MILADAAAELVLVLVAIVVCLAFATFTFIVVAIFNLVLIGIREIAHRRYRRKRAARHAALWRDR